MVSVVSNYDAFEFVLPRLRIITSISILTHVYKVRTGKEFFHNMSQTTEILLPNP